MRGGEISRKLCKLPGESRPRSWPWAGQEGTGTRSIWKAKLASHGNGFWSGGWLGKPRQKVAQGGTGPEGEGTAGAWEAAEEGFLGGDAEGSPASRCSG